MPLASLPDGVQLRYEIHGHGSQRVAFITGLLAPLEAWKPQIDFFSTHQREKLFQILVFDNRGCGGSSAPAGRYTTSSMAQDTLHLIDYIGWMAPVHLVGMSMGGMIAQELCLQASSRVRSLTLVNTHLGKGIRTCPPATCVWGLMRGVLARSPTAKVQRSLELLYSKEHLEAVCSYDPDRTNREDLTEMHLERLRMVPPPSIRGVMGQIAATTTHHVAEERMEIFRKGLFPVLIMTSTGDKMIRPRNSLFIKQLVPDAEMIVFPHAGHAVQAECRDRFNHVLSEFITRAHQDQADEVSSL